MRIALSITIGQKHSPSQRRTRLFLDTEIYICSTVRPRHEDVGGSIAIGACLALVTDDRNVSTTARDIFLDSANDLLLSAVTGFEIVVKYSLGMLRLAEPPREFVQNRIRNNALVPLSIALRHNARNIYTWDVRYLRRIFVMHTARIFTNGNSQAVRLPKEYRFNDDEVIIKKVGRAVLLLPKRYSANELEALLNEVGPLEIERDQPKDQQERDFS